MDPVEERVRERLATYDAPILAALLKRRDVMTVPWPSDLHDLARRLAAAPSSTEAYLRMSRPCVEVLSAVSVCAAIGVRPTVDVVSRRLGTTADAVTPIVDEIEQSLLAWIERDEIVTSGTFPIAGRPLGSGIREHLDHATLSNLRPMCRRLGLPDDGIRPDVIARLHTFFSQTSAIAELLNRAPASTRQLVEDAAHMDAVLQRPNSAVWPGEWALDRGLAWKSGDGAAALPIEVTLAILGGTWTLPFHPVAPDVSTRSVTRDHVEVEATTRLLRMVELVSTVIDAVRSTPIPMVKSTSIGVRAVRGLAKDARAETVEIELALELARHNALLRIEDQPRATGLRRAPATLTVSTRASSWQSAEVGTRAAALLLAWWQSAGTRTRCVDVHLDLPSDQAFAENCDVVTMLEWSAPTLTSDLVASTLRDAELLGVVALGAASSLARALRDGNAVTVTTQMMSSARTKATLGNDLTAVVFGPPDIELTHFFDSVAGRESSGAATTWRFVPSSVRRAFDGGSTVQQILSDLQSFTTGDIPQPLTYLINDVARTYGSLSVMRLGCAVVAEDEALVAEVAADRRLATLGMRVLSATVLGFTNEVDAVVLALRESGYAPVQRDSDGKVVITARAKPVAQGSYVKSATTDLMQQAKFLLDARTPASNDPHDVLRRVMSESDQSAKHRFAMGRMAVIDYRGRELTVHSARLRGAVIEVWNVAGEHYESLTPSAVRVVR